VVSAESRQPIELGLNLALSDTSDRPKLLRELFELVLTSFPDDLDDINTVLNNIGEPIRIVQKFLGADRC